MNSLLQTGDLRVVGVLVLLAFFQLCSRHR